MFDEDGKLATKFGLDYLLKIISKAHNPAYLKYVLFCSIALNICLWLAVIFFSPEIYNFIFLALDFSAPGEYETGDDGGLLFLVIYLLIAGGITLAFSLGFLISYCISSLLRPEVEASRKMDSEFMAGYGYISNERSKSRIHMISGAFGAANLFLLLALFLSLK